LNLDTSNSLGSILKTEREKRGLGLQQVFEATRITTQNLAALEDDRFDYFPNKVYSRAFLRDYANYLGLDSSLLLARYEDEWSRPAPQDQTPAPERATARGSKAWVVIVIMIVLAAACAAGVYYKTKMADKAAQSQQYPETTVTEPATPEGMATVPKAPPVNGQDESAPTPTEPTTETAAQPPVTDRVVVQITAKDTEPLWVRVYTDASPRPVYMSTMQPGQTLEWSGAKKVTVRVARGNAADVKLNGVALPPLGTEETPANGVFTLEDVKRVIKAAGSETSSPTPGPNPTPGPR
jgi:cytoskeleton protein RodZ